MEFDATRNNSPKRTPGKDESTAKQQRGEHRSGEGSTSALQRLKAWEKTRAKGREAAGKPSAALQFGPEPPEPSPG